MSIKEQFEQNTIDKAIFDFIDVPADGSCAYRCMAISLSNHFHSQYRLSIETNVKLELTINWNSSYINYLYDALFQSIRDSDDDVKKTDFIGQIAELLQNIIREWIVAHKDMIVPEFDELLESYLLSCHELESIEEYDQLYRIYSGANDYYMEDTGRINKKGKAIMKKVYFQERWAGTPELYAFSQIFNSKVNVYMSQKMQANKIIFGAIKHCDTRLNLCQIFEPLENQIQFKCHFLHTKKRREGHYMYMNEKN